MRVKVTVLPMKEYKACQVLRQVVRFARRKKGRGERNVTDSEGGSLLSLGGVLRAFLKLLNENCESFFEISLTL